MPRHRLRDAIWAWLHTKLRAVSGIWKKDSERRRQFVEAVVHVLRTGVAWEGLPERSGQPNSLHRRFRRRSLQGIRGALCTAGVPEDALGTVMIDATITKVPRLASGARDGGGEGLGRSRGGPTTIVGTADDPSAPQRGPFAPRGIHTLVDGRGRPLCYLPTPGQAADCRQVQALLEGVSFAWLIGDRATDARRAWCAEHALEAVTPSRRNRKVPIPHDQVRYRARHRVENLFSRVKDHTRITLRKGKTQHSYAGFVSLAFTLIDIQLCQKTVGCDYSQDAALDAALLVRAPKPGPLVPFSGTQPGQHLLPPALLRVGAGKPIGAMQDRATEDARGRGAEDQATARPAHAVRHESVQDCAMDAGSSRVHASKFTRPADRAA